MIHSTAIIHSKAEIGKNVSIGPYSIIEEEVIIGNNVQIDSHVVIKKWTSIGEDCILFMGAVLGNSAQDKKYDGQCSYLTIGKGNVFREYVTVHRGNKAEGYTKIGDHNYFMVNSHIAHNCEIGNEITIANGSNIAGHVIIEDRAFISGLVVVHQFVRIGRLSIIGGNSKVVQDVPPYLLVDGHPAKAYGLNSVGLLRAKIPEDSKIKLKKSYKLLYRSEYSISKALQKIKEEIEKDDYVDHLVQFIESSERGICRGVEVIKSDSFEDL
ncbi:acyl-ACP--UDP-N-acetylglucosamine O-acyltransferase [bacterium]|nr:acyl-ACP--UDP-N-acetylglucosamine O-acyltransferase [bacterium]MBU1154029.1 acyl-ACP--UDP-N-acetylglucosamine O-acyltransferase [bacterium]MBU1782172.1 acyl-ACP--UDP-N-acetylglucosamine O-acyltransferase [bacterium]